jgi:hypothetical protein
MVSASNASPLLPDTPGFETRLWTMRADGSDARRLWTMRADGSDARRLPMTQPVDRAQESSPWVRVPSWEEHLHQHGGRLTATDQRIEEAALAFSDRPATADHLLPA